MIVFINERKVTLTAGGPANFSPKTIDIDCKDVFKDLDKDKATDPEEDPAQCTSQ